MQGVTKYPEVIVQLSGCDGNAFAIMGAVVKAMKKAGISKEETNAYFAEATSGDYEHLIRTSFSTVTCE